MSEYRPATCTSCWKNTAKPWGRSSWQSASIVAPPRLRKGTCLTISEAAFRWGFNDMSYFSRAFRRRFGVVPRDYRQ
ncbi:helix-turn-helix domain-containing protein [Agrobacterium vitis]|uniref:helix-turn-helix domain-containing protein n=1 Tax=Agrobacterium vitis TaxID=373 RepID=UPI003D2BC7D1